MGKLEKEVQRIKKTLREKFGDKRIIIVGVAGGSAAGKTTIARMLSKKILVMDDYGKGLSVRKDMNFDKPDVVDFKLLIKHFKSLKKERDVKKPVYDFKIHERIGFERFKPNKIIVLDGLFALHRKILKYIDFGIFVDTKGKIRLKRRISRDIKERGRTKKSVLKQWKETVVPGFKGYVLPTKRYADIVVKGY